MRQHGGGGDRRGHSAVPLTLWPFSPGSPGSPSKPLSPCGGRTDVRLSPRHPRPRKDLGVLAPHPAASTDTTPRTRPWVRFPPGDPWHHLLQHDPARQGEGVGRGPRLRAPRDGKGGPLARDNGSGHFGRGKIQTPSAYPSAQLSRWPRWSLHSPGTLREKRGRRQGWACLQPPRPLQGHNPAHPLLPQPSQGRLTRGPTSPASPFRPGCPGRPYKNRRAWRLHQEGLLEAEMCPTRCILVGWATRSGPHTSRTHQRSWAASQPHGAWGTLHGKLGRDRRGVRGSGEAGQGG